MNGNNTNWDEIIERLPILLNQLVNSAPHRIKKLFESKVRRLIGDPTREAGIYLFSRLSDNDPVYVGRSANLPQRLGNNHRSTAKNRAPVTKYLMNKHNLPSMSQARQHLYENYQVRFITEPNVHTRAILEICAAMVLHTEFNTFKEH